MTDQDNAGSTESDYRKNGYSEWSLEMLESEEGQLNAVFACYGSAAQHGQLFADSLAKLVALLNDWLGGSNPVARLEKKTIGELLAHPFLELGNIAIERQNVPTNVLRQPGRELPIRYDRLIKCELEARAVEAPTLCSTFHPVEDVTPDRGFSALRLAVPRLQAASER